MTLTLSTGNEFLVKGRPGKSRWQWPNLAAVLGHLWLEKARSCPLRVTGWVYLHREQKCKCGYWDELGQTFLYWPRGALTSPISEHRRGQRGEQRGAQGVEEGFRAVEPL